MPNRCYKIYDWGWGIKVLGTGKLLYSKIGKIRQSLYDYTDTWFVLRKVFYE